jgi:GTPase SAR1 family protein
MSETNFVNAFAQTLQQRAQVADRLQQMADQIQQAETTGDSTSGQLGLTRDIQALALASQQLREGVFRLMVLGDMKRGKSTLINALLGEAILPSDVNPNTALLTVVKYGAQKQVTVHFNTERSPETLDIETFRTTYILSPEETKTLEEQHTIAFPDVSHAVLEYPSPLLEQGVEIIDTPGLNDTETRNQLVLEQLGTCHAVLFVLSATQPFTLDERRYIQNYLQDRGLPLFFIINGWDRLASSLVDPDSAEELAVAQEKIRQVFQTQLIEYCPEAEYGDRVFELSALQALRERIQNEAGNSEFTEFEEKLRVFLTVERFTVQLKWAEQVAQRVIHHVQAAVERRIPLLSDTPDELKQKIVAAEEEFGQLEELCEQFRALVSQTSDRQAKEITESFQTYLLGLEATFEQDFAQSKPDLSWQEFLDPQNRENFYKSFRRAFERYINDRMIAWEHTARQSMMRAIDQLNEQASEYQVTYERIVNSLNQKFLGDRFEAIGKRYQSEINAVWADSVFNFFNAVPGSMNSVASEFSVFWQRVFEFALGYAFAYIGIAIGLRLVAILFSSYFIPGAFLVGLGAIGLVAAQAESVRQTFLETTKREFAKCLPQIAQEQKPTIARAVHRCFAAYEVAITEQVTADITARQTEMLNLLHQKENHEIERDQEVKRLQQFAALVTEAGHQISL